jgi:hypothetical protein
MPDPQSTTVELSTALVRQVVSLLATLADSDEDDLDHLRGDVRRTRDALINELVADKLGPDMLSASGDRGRGR